MLKTNDNPNSKTSQLSEYEFRHEKNAFTVGDKVCVWKSGKPSYKVWRTVVEVDPDRGKLFFEDSKEWWTIHGSTENRKDGIVTVDAWDKAFENCEAWKNDKEKKGYVVSYETVDGVLYVVITNNRPKIHTKWYYRHDNGSYFRKEDTSVKNKILWVCREGSASVIKVANNGRALMGDNDVDVEPELGWWFEPKTKNGPIVWNGEKAKEICEKCPWLLETKAIWRYQGKDLEAYGRPLIDFGLDGKKLVCKNGENVVKVLFETEIEEKDTIVKREWVFMGKGKPLYWRIEHKTEILTACPWLKTMNSYWFGKGWKKVLFVNPFKQ